MTWLRSHEGPGTEIPATSVRRREGEQECDRGEHRGEDRGAPPRSGEPAPNEQHHRDDRERDGGVADEECPLGDVGRPSVEHPAAERAQVVQERVPLRRVEVGGERGGVHGQVARRVAGLGLHGRALVPVETEDREQGHRGHGERERTERHGAEAVTGTDDFDRHEHDRHQRRKQALVRRDPEGEPDRGPGDRGPGRCRLRLEAQQRRQNEDEHPVLDETRVAGISPLDRVRAEPEHQAAEHGRDEGAAQPVEEREGRHRGGEEPEEEERVPGADEARPRRAQPR